MDDLQLSEDLLDFNLKDIFNFTFDFDSLNSIDKISTQWLDELTSSITIENNEISATNTSIQKDRTADASSETIGVSNQQKAKYIDLKTNNNPEPPSNNVEIMISSDAVQDDAPLSPPIVDLQTENMASDLLWMQDSDLIMKTTESRICLSKEELSILEREFQICHYPDRFTRNKLALTLNLSRLAVSEWFTNRRIKMRKQTSGNVEENGEIKKNNFSESQVAMLEREFEKSQYPDCLIRQKLSLMLGLRDVTVKNWFHYRRVKMRKLMEEAQLATLQTQSSTLLASKTLIQRQDLTEKTDINNNQSATVEHILEKQQTQYDAVRESVSPHISLNRQIEELQTKTSCLLSSTELNQDSEQQTLKTLVQLVQSSTNNNQQIPNPQIDISSLSSSLESNQTSEQKVPEKLVKLVQPQIESTLSLSSNRPSNRKRKRTNFSKSQLSVLEHQFIKCEYPNFHTICQLASTIHVTNDNIKIWFKNRRSKQRDLEKNSKIVQSQTKTISLSQTKSTSTQKCKRNSSRKSRLGELEREFKKCPYQDLIKLCQLASETKFTNSKVKRWFTRQRVKQRLLEKGAKKIAQEKETSNIALQLGSFEQNFRSQGAELNSNVPYTTISKWFSDQRVKEKTSETGLLIETSRPQYRSRKIHFNKSQLAILKNAFTQCQYLDYDTTCSLSSILNVSYERVRTWFKNRRSKQRELNKYGQLLQSQIETSRFLPSSETHSIEAQYHEKQIQTFQDYQQLPLVGVDCYDNALCNNVQQTRVYPQNLRFEWYNSVSPTFIPQSYGMTAFPPIQEDAFYINPASPSAQQVHSHSYDASLPNHLFLAEL